MRGCDVGAEVENACTVLSTRNVLSINIAMCHVANIPRYGSYSLARTGSEGNRQRRQQGSIGNRQRRLQRLQRQQEGVSFVYKYEAGPLCFGNNQAVLPSSMQSYTCLLRATLGANRQTESDHDHL